MLKNLRRACICCFFVLILGIIATVVMVSTSKHVIIRNYVSLHRTVFQPHKSVLEEPLLLEELRYKVLSQDNAAPDSDVLTATVNSTASFNSSQSTQLDVYIPSKSVAIVQKNRTVQRMSYLLAIVYAEQLNSATHHYASLVNIGSQWRMKSIEPLIARSRLYGLHCLSGPKMNESFHNYGHFFDINHINSYLSGCLLRKNESLITSRMEFYLKSYRNITVVHFVHSGLLPVVTGCNGIPSNKPYLQELQRAAESMVECTGVAKMAGMTVNIERMLNEGLDRYGVSSPEGFYVRKVICVNANKDVSLTRLKEVVMSGEDNKSVLFTYWQGGRTASSFSGMQFNTCSLSHQHIHHSQTVSRTASVFADSLSLRRPFLSLHIRSERVIHINSLYPGYQACCMRRLHTLINRIMKKHKLLDVLLVRDYGKYGTDSCFYGHHSKPNWYCKQLSDLMMEEIRKWGFQYAAFDPVKFGTVDNSGFVSLVESEALLQGEVLLTVGRGSFQAQLIDGFSDQMPHKAKNSQIYRICPCLQYGQEDHHGLLDNNTCERLLYMH